MKEEKFANPCLNYGYEIAWQDHYFPLGGVKRQRQRLRLIDFMKHSLKSFMALDGPFLIFSISFTALIISTVILFVLL